MLKSVGLVPENTVLLEDNTLLLALKNKENLLEKPTDPLLNLTN
jgi:hypothetical protein